ncbi:MAG: D-alanine--D-alanine ligase [Nitrospirae bacterium]|nr:MAG: D-alanine--D-alanine ligase [Nitrospirota bacterium]
MRRHTAKPPLTTARIGVLMGGWSMEREISLRTGAAVLKALLRRGYRAVGIDVDASLPWRLRAHKVELAFLALHGPGGEDGTVQGLLEILRIPYTGSDVKASAVAMDKPTAKALLASQGVPVPQGTVVTKGAYPDAPPAGWEWPLIVKPAAQGSTVGVSIVRTPAQWRKALRLASQQGERIVVEPYIAGREVAVSVLDGEALPVVEIVAPQGFYDYDAKYTKQDTEYRCPAPLSSRQTEALKEWAVRCFHALGCDGAARVDFRINRRGRPYVLEVNTIPGMTERSLLPMAAAYVGLDYDTLTERILQSALRRDRAWAEAQPHRLGRNASTIEDRRKGRACS